MSITATFECLKISNFTSHFFMFFGFEWPQNKCSSFGIVADPHHAILYLNDIQQRQRFIESGCHRSIEQYHLHRYNSPVQPCAVSLCFQWKISRNNTIIFHWLLSNRLWATSVTNAPDSDVSDIWVRFIQMKIVHCDNDSRWKKVSFTNGIKRKIATFHNFTEWFVLKFISLKRAIRWQNDAHYRRLLETQSILSFGRSIQFGQCNYYGLNRKCKNLNDKCLFHAIDSDPKLHAT